MGLIVEIPYKEDGETEYQEFEIWANGEIAVPDDYAEQSDLDLAEAEFTGKLPERAKFLVEYNSLGLRGALNTDAWATSIIDAGQEQGWDEFFADDNEKERVVDFLKSYVLNDLSESDVVVEVLLSMIGEDALKKWFADELQAKVANDEYYSGLAERAKEYLDEGDIEFTKDIYTPYGDEAYQEQRIGEFRVYVMGEEIIRWEVRVWARIVNPVGLYVNVDEEDEGFDKAKDAGETLLFIFGIDEPEVEDPDLEVPEISDSDDAPYGVLYLYSGDDNMEEETVVPYDTLADARDAEDLSLLVLARDGEDDDYDVAIVRRKEPETDTDTAECMGDLVSEDWQEWGWVDDWCIVTKEERWSDVKA